MSNKTVNDALDFMPAANTNSAGQMLRSISGFAKAIGDGYKAGTMFRDLVDEGIPAEKAVRQALDTMGKKVA